MEPVTEPSRSDQDTALPDVETEKPKGKKVVFLYSIKEAAEALNNLTLVINNDISNDGQECTVEQEPQSIETVTAFPSTSNLSCSTCTLSFDARSDMVDHLKSDFHRYNVHMKLRGLTPVTEQTFEEMTGEISSISGSDSEDSETTDTCQDEWTSSSASQLNDPKDEELMKFQNRSQRILFRNGNGELVSIYRCVIFGKKSQLSTSADILRAANSLLLTQRWAIFMTGGGHFAGAIFDGDKILQHKTFHRYTVRAKAGKVQSQRDKQGGAPRSVGATIRRHHEAALAQEIQDLITSWSAEIKTCSKIFLRAPGHNSAIFFGGKTPVLDKSDTRISVISIRTRRPTFHELKRVHGELSSIEVFDPDCSISDCISPRKKTQSPEGDLSVITESPEVKVAENEMVVPSNITETVAEHEIGHTKDKEESCDDSSSSDCAILKWEMITANTSELNQFECTRRPRRKKKPAKKKKKNIDDSVTLSDEQTEIRNRLFTACKTGDLEGFQSSLECLSNCLQQQQQQQQQPVSNDKVPEELCSQFSESLSTTDHDTASHTSPELKPTNDRGLEKRLSEFLNLKFGPQSTTLLHVAARSGHKHILSELMRRGADPAVRDAQHQVPFLHATIKDIKNEFRRFMAEYPTKYDYLKAQIPGPLTAEMENERKVKATEKKKIQKKAKKEKIKEAQEEEERKKVEEKEKREFLAMTDREKRAYAAEQRFKKQREQESATKVTNVSRCWECGFDLTGKVPYEYYDYKFCSPSCLKEHRSKNTS